jgi:hypothetical protein
MTSTNHLGERVVMGIFTKSFFVLDAEDGDAMWSSKLESAESRERTLLSRLPHGAAEIVSGKP